MMVAVFLVVPMVVSIAATFSREYPVSATWSYVGIILALAYAETLPPT